MLTELHELTAAQAGVFTAAQATAFGLTRDELRSQLRSGSIVPVRRKVYAPAHVLDQADDRTRHRVAVAAALVTRGWIHDEPGPPTLVAGHRSAALLWNLPRPPGDTCIHLVSGDRCRRTYRAGVCVQPAALPPIDLGILDGLPITSIARTAVDMMRESPRGWALIAADAALRLGCDPVLLTEVAHRCARWRGGKQAEELAALADGRAESPAESLARLALIDAGLRPSDLQYGVVDGNGVRRRLDIAYPEDWTALEVDGRVKYDEPYGDPERVLWEEKLREDAVRDTGWEVVRTNWREITQSPDQLVHRVRAAIRRARLRRAS